MGKGIQRIFIGGTGRSGTSILLHALYRHHQIYAVPIESKFIVEADGLTHLADLLTTRFSPSASREGIARFSVLVTEVLTGSRQSYFLSDAYARQEFILSELFPNYTTVMNKFIKAIQPGFFERRARLIRYMQELVDGLFTTEAQRLGKTSWVEKTPNNIFEMPFLTELFPDLCFIHIKRDPRGVFDSLWRKGWLPHNLDKALPIFVSWLKCWTKVNRKALTRRYLEITLEDFALDPAAVLAKATDFLCLERHCSESVAQVAQTMSNHWGHPISDKAATIASLEQFRTTFSTRQLKKIERVLMPSMVMMGYPLSA